MSQAFCLICISLMQQSFALMMICSDESPEFQLNSEMGMEEKGNHERHYKLKKPIHSDNKVKLR